MSLKKWLGVAFLVLLGIFGLILIYDNRQISQIRVQKPNSDPMYSNEQKIIGWIPYWDQEKAFQSFSSNADKIDIISVFWYQLDEDGKLAKYENTLEDQKIIDFAKTNNVEIHAVIANLPDHNEDVQDWDYKRVNKAISSQKSRELHIKELINLVEEKKFDGIDIDYESLRGSQRDSFSVFIDELAHELHKRDKALGVSIHPKTGEFLPQEDNGSHAQDLARLSNSADYLYFMTYLENGTFSEPGPLGSPAWTEKIMRYALDEIGIPREKAFLGVGLMGAEWRKEEDDSYKGYRDDVKFEEILTLVNNNGIEVKFDTSSITPFINYEKYEEEESFNHVIWFENAISVADRLKLAQDLGVGGIAFWRLGGEDSKIWESIN